MHRTLTALLALTIASTGLTLATVPAVAAGELVKLRLNQAIDKLPVASETRRGYEREKFVHWVDGDGDCQDTRDEVLAAESLVKVTGCDIQRGKWRSYYDGATTRSSTGFDIDHLVPLAEAWDSGAKRWNEPTRQRFANDLNDSRSLVAVTASSNRSKSDRDPSEWMPALGKCVYIRQWVAVKIRWRLKVNRPEKQALRARAADCANSTIQVRRAVVVLAPRPRAAAAARVVVVVAVGTQASTRDSATAMRQRQPATGGTTEAETPSTPGTPTATATGSSASEPRQSPDPRSTITATRPRR